MPMQDKLRSVFDVRGNSVKEPGDRRHKIADPVRNTLVVLLGEFCGTFMFLLLSFIGAQTAIKNNAPTDTSGTLPLLPFSLMYIAASFGSALAVNVWIFYRVSGGMFNPAVTLGLVLVGAIKPLRAAMIVPVQLVAAIAAAAAVDGMLPGPLGVTNTLGDGTSKVQGVFLEMFLTAQLVLTVYFLAVEKHRSTFLAPVAIGLSVFIAHIALTNYTGTGINPARSFGPAVISGFVGYHWIYWVGPLMGALLAFAVYSALKWLEYHTANPGQDATDVEMALAAAQMHAPKVQARTNNANHARGSSAVSDATLQVNNSNGIKETKMEENNIPPVPQQLNQQQVNQQVNQAGNQALNDTVHLGHPQAQT